jgi:hypothetical protein
MINNSGGVRNNSASFNYAPTINGGTPYMTRTQVESMLRAHGGAFEGWVRNMANNGWRP